MHRIPYGGRVTRALVPAALMSLMACSGITDTLLEATDPDVINPGGVNSIEGARGLHIGTISRLTEVTAGNESTWLFGGLLGDEWATSSTFVQNDETDQRRIQENNSQITNMLYRLYRTRTAANQAIAALNEWEPTATDRIAESYFARGFVDLQLASDFCNGIPLSDGAGETVTYGQPQTVAQVFASAIAAFDSAYALTTGSTVAATIAIGRAALVGKARAQVGLNQIDAAADHGGGHPDARSCTSRTSPSPRSPTPSGGRGSRRTATRSAIRYRGTSATSSWRTRFPSPR